MSDPVARGIAAPARPSTRIGAWLASESRSGPGFVVSDATALSKVLVRPSQEDTLRDLDPPAPGWARWDRDRLISHVSPGEWLVIGPPSGSPAVLPDRWQTRISAARSSAVDVTHARSGLHVRGPGTAELLGRVCAIDLARRPPLTSLRTHVAGVVTEVVVLDEAAGSLLLLADRSYGVYLLETILQRGIDLGIALGGLEAWPPRSGTAVGG